jgi:hypothetical protein
MLIISDDQFIYRLTGWYCYLITLAGLMYCGFYSFIFLYFWTGMTMLATDGYHNDMHELDWVRQYEHLWSLRPFEQLDGLVLFDWEMDEIVANVMEFPSFSDSYKLYTPYKARLLNTRRQLNSVDSDNILNQLKLVDSFDLHKLLAARLQLSWKFGKEQVNPTVLFDSAILKFYRRKQLLKFRSVESISTVFLAETVLGRGIYPYSEYHYDRHFAPSNYYTIFVEFLLISEAKPSHFFGPKKRLKEIEKSMLQELQPDDEIYYDYLNARLRD